MESVLVDTDVFSFGFKGDTRSEAYRPATINAQLFLSFQTVAELRYWGLSRKWGPARLRELNDAIAHCIVIPFDNEMATLWASITAERQFTGKPIASGDAWIAATAIRHKLPLLTHNKFDFRDISALILIA